jgi:hypothetical protein
MAANINASNKLSAFSFRLGQSTRMYGTGIACHQLIPFLCTYIQLKYVGPDDKCAVLSLCCLFIFNMKRHIKYTVTAQTDKRRLRETPKDHKRPEETEQKALNFSSNPEINAQHE